MSDFATPDVELSELAKIARRLYEFGALYLEVSQPRRWQDAHYKTKLGDALADYWKLTHAAIPHAPDGEEEC